jgi:hypothetical protein
MRSAGLTIRLVAALLLVAGCGACAQVKPWQRELLARRDMAWAPDPLEAARRDHIYFAKEASPVGGTGGGGGCGCN